MVVDPAGGRRVFPAPEPVADIEPTPAADVALVHFAYLPQDLPQGPAALFSARTGDYLPIAGSNVQYPAFAIDAGAPVMDYFMLDGAGALFGVDAKAWRLDGFERCRYRLVSHLRSVLVDFPGGGVCDAGGDGWITSADDLANPVRIDFDFSGVGIGTNPYVFSPTARFFVVSLRSGSMLVVDTSTGATTQLADEVAGGVVGWLDDTTVLVTSASGLDRIDIVSGERATLRPLGGPSAIGSGWCLPRLHPQVLVEWDAPERGFLDGRPVERSVRLFDTSGKLLQEATVRGAPSCGPGGPLVGGAWDSVLWSRDTRGNGPFSPYLIDTSARAIVRFDHLAAAGTDVVHFAEGPGALAAVSVATGDERVGLLLAGDGVVRRVSDVGWVSAAFAPSGDRLVVDPGGRAPSRIIGLDGTALAELDIAQPAWLRAA